MVKLNYKNIRLIIIILVMIILLNLLYVYLYLNQSHSLQEGIGVKVPPSKITVALLDTNRAKPDTNLNGKFSIGTQYDTSMTVFTLSNETIVPITVADTFMITIKPKIKDISLNKMDNSSNKLDNSSNKLDNSSNKMDNSSNITDADADDLPKKLDKFPNKFKITLAFDTTGPKYYLSQVESTNTINSKKELNVYTVAAGITNASYQNIGLVTKDTYNPYLYGVSITENGAGADITAVNVYFTNKDPNSVPNAAKPA